MRSVSVDMVVSPMDMDVDVGFDLIAPAGGQGV
jgi:hypothetical protein